MRDASSDANMSGSGAGAPPPAHQHHGGQTSGAVGTLLYKTTVGLSPPNLNMLGQIGGAAPTQFGINLLKDNHGGGVHNGGANNPSPFGQLPRGISSCSTVSATLSHLAPDEDSVSIVPVGGFGPTFQLYMPSGARVRDMQKAARDFVNQHAHKFTKTDTATELLNLKTRLPLGNFVLLRCSADSPANCQGSFVEKSLNSFLDLSNGKGMVIGVGGGNTSVVANASRTPKSGGVVGGGPPGGPSLSGRETSTTGFDSASSNCSAHSEPKNLTPLDPDALVSTLGPRCHLMLKELVTKDPICTRVFPWEAIRHLRSSEPVTGFTPVPVWWRNPSGQMAQRSDVLAYRRYDLRSTQRWTSPTYI